MTTFSPESQPTEWDFAVDCHGGSFKVSSSAPEDLYPDIAREIFEDMIGSTYPWRAELKRALEAHPDIDDYEFEGHTVR